MAIGSLASEQDLENFVRRLFDRWGANRFRPPRYLTAKRPAAADKEGLIIYVPDAAAGSKYQGSDGASWVSLG